MQRSDAFPEKWDCMNGEFGVPDWSRFEGVEVWPVVVEEDAICEVITDKNDSRTPSFWTVYGRLKGTVRELEALHDLPTVSEISALASAIMNTVPFGIFYGHPESTALVNPALEYVPF